MILGENEAWGRSVGWFGVANLAKGRRTAISRVLRLRDSLVTD